MNRVHASLPRGADGKKPNPRRLLLVDRTGRVYYPELGKALTFCRNINTLQVLVRAGLTGMCDPEFLREGFDREIAQVTHGTRIPYDLQTLFGVLEPFV